MRIGLLVASIGNFGKKGFYNAQEIGLAKALDPFVDEVQVYKAVPQNQERKREPIEKCENSWLNLLSTKSIGSNGMFDLNGLDTRLDALIFFSDTQVIFPSVYKWAKKNQVKLFPYIGVLESHSVNILKRSIMSLFSERNISAYKKCHCFAKTQEVQEKLRRNGVHDITLLPVGLDLSLMKEDFEEYDPLELKREFGFSAEDRVLLFVGRLINEKRPGQMIEIFAQLIESNQNYRLLMVGSGPLDQDVDAAISKYHLGEKVVRIVAIANNEIWKLYRFAEAFVNLNQQEIFGMSILEAMYYGCKVVAWIAPGPNCIIENGVSGWLVDENQAIVDRLNSDDLDMYIKDRAHERIIQKFTWSKTAESIIQIISNA